jgi:hypothetical protein
VDERLIAKIRRRVVETYPEMKGAEPSVRRLSGNNGRVQLTFKAQADLPGGRKMRRVVRVVADEDGHILRMSSSK